MQLVSVFTPGGVSYLHIPAPDPRAAAVDETLDPAAAHDGEVLAAPYPEGDLWVATLRDPSGNLIGAGQQGPR